ncbi:MAG: phosphoribosylformylglycinamidine synthase subunit PurQ [Candidatus Pelagibacterales bacterium]|nr:MAG: phosphoribosylformylglycinamidine synthase subunit PurQ [Pelagibacterales bacterium]
MKSSVIVFPGSNCDRDIAVALEKFQIKNQMIWHNDASLPKSDLVVLPGGFSYGDYLRTGCIASKSKILDDVIKHAKNGGLLLGICNGFQILTETGLLPGVLLRNKKLRFLSKNVFLKVINFNNRFCHNYKKKDTIELPIAHNEGNYFANEKEIKKLEDNDLIAFKYSDKEGNINENTNPNGSSQNIAGILNNKKNILGMMPHPERLIDPLLSGEDGSLMFESLIKS